MTRVKSMAVSRKSHKKIINAVSGFTGRRNHIYSIAIRAYIKSLMYSRRDRRKNKSIYRSYHIKIINNYLSLHKLKYSYTINILKINTIIINRYMLYLLLTNNITNIIIISLFKILGC